ncbi:MAG: DUF6521 family protein [Kofleriaceae bacterium]
MREWEQRSVEEAYLLNPAFCSLLLSEAIHGHHSETGESMTFTGAFLILPIVLHKATREAIPRMITATLATWLDVRPEIILRFPDRARSLVPFTKEAILFGACRSTIRVAQDGALMPGAVVPTTRKYLLEATAEVIDCMKKARFVGRWFGKSGSVSTVMALFGVAP